jgi:hypothetical protein
MVAGLTAFSLVLAGLVAKGSSMRQPVAGDVLGQPSR